VPRVFSSAVTNGPKRLYLVFCLAIAWFTSLAPNGYNVMSSCQKEALYRAFDPVNASIRTCGGLIVSIISTVLPVEPHNFFYHRVDTLLSRLMSECKSDTSILAQLLRLSFFYSCFFQESACLIIAAGTCFFTEVLRFLRLSVGVAQ